MPKVYVTDKKPTQADSKAAASSLNANFFSNLQRVATPPTLQFTIDNVSANELEVDKVANNLKSKNESLLQSKKAASVEPEEPKKYTLNGLQIGVPDNQQNINEPRSCTAFQLKPSSDSMIESKTFSGAQPIQRFSPLLKIGLGLGAAALAFSAGGALYSRSDSHINRNDHNIFPNGILRRKSDGVTGEYTYEKGRDNLYLDDDGREWRLMPDYKNRFHQPDDAPRGSAPNKKFLAFDDDEVRSFEAILQPNQDGTYTDNWLNEGSKQGTYNYYDPDVAPIRHGLFDVLPHFINSNYSNTPIPESVENSPIPESVENFGTETDQVPHIIKHGPKSKTPSDDSQPIPEIHQVVRGDNLWNLANSYYGDPRKYTLIFSANSDQIADPHRIFPGQKLIIPNIK